MIQNNKFIFAPHRPVVLTKKCYIDNKEIEKKFLFHSSEQQGGEGEISYHKFTIYFCEITAKEGHTKASFNEPNCYSMFIRGKKRHLLSHG